MKIQQNIPKYCLIFIVLMAIYFIYLNFVGFNYSNPLKKEYEISIDRLKDQNQINKNIVYTIDLWEKYPNLMIEEYAVSQLAMKKKTARYFDYQSK